jgi:hypothetical protein
MTEGAPPPPLGNRAESDVAERRHNARAPKRQNPRGLASGACRYAYSMATEAAVGKVAEATGERVRGGRVSRPKALLASAIVGVGAAVATFMLLRSGGEK